MILHELVQLEEGALLREQREQRATHLAVGRVRVWGCGGVGLGCWGVGCWVLGLGLGLGCWG